MRSGRLADLSVVVVGGTGGLGLSAARACLGEDARLTVVGRATDDLDRAAGALGGATGIVTGDAVEPGVVQRAIELAVQNFGRLDAVFHVAGGSGRRFGDGPLDQITDDGWTQTIDANLRSMFNTNRAATRHFLGAGHGGSVLNMSSVLAFSPSPAHFATHAYAAAKAGVNGLTTACAAYYASHAIRFNAIAPGLVRTAAAQRAATDPMISEYIRKKQPLDGGRTGEPDDLNSAIIYFLSSESRFVTGQVLSVDGGWSVCEP